MAKKKDDKLDLLTKVATGVAFGDTSNSAVRNVLTEISKELYGRITNDQMHETMEFFGWKCPYTGADMHALIEKGDYATDHIYPQNQEWCGLNVQGNLVLVDKRANNAKKGLDVETFLLTDTKVLHDVDNGMTRQERLDKIRAFQTKFKYEPERIRKVVRPLMEERYKLVREEQEACIRDVMTKLGEEGIKPLQFKTTEEKVSRTRSGEAVGKGYTYDEKLGIALYYLEHEEGLVQVEESCMKLIGRHGATAKYILNTLGIDTRKESEHKGLLSKPRANIEDEIERATGVFRITLEEIKKRRLKWVNKHPYIHYKKGWESFPNQEEHCVEYCIDGNTISISKAVGFTPSRKETKQISANDMTTLIAILDEAKKNSLFEVSNTCIHTGHGVYCSYDYSYCGQSGMECRGLFIDACKADVLQDRYNNLIETLLK